MNKFYNDYDEDADNEQNIEAYHVIKINFIIRNKHMNINIDQSIEDTRI